MRFGLWVAVFVGLAVAGTNAALAASRAEFDQLVTQLQAKPSDNALRERIIKMALELKPAPAIPEEARQNFVTGSAIAKGAPNASGQKLAIKKFQEALKIAPWWGEAYYNLATAQELAGQFAAAKTSLQRYIMTKPDEKDARDAQDRIYVLDGKIEVAKATPEQGAKAPKTSITKAAPTPPAPDPAEVKRAEEARRWNARWILTNFNSEFGAGNGGYLQSNQIGNVIEFWTTGASVNLLVLRGTISTNGSIAWELNNQSCGMPPVSVAVSPDFNTLQYSSSINVFNCSNDFVNTVTITRQ